MGKIRKGVKCVVKNCNEKAVRSISVDKLDMLKIQPSQSRRAYLCDQHYKEYKKQTRKDRIIEKWKFTK